MITRLSWDSECFGYEVGKVDQEADFNTEKFLEEAQAYQLVYIFSKKNLYHLPSSIQQVDQKVYLEKKLFPISKVIQNPIQASGMAGQGGRVIKLGTSDISLIDQVKDFESTFFDLALISGEYSRFHIDKRLKNHEFQKLYNSWARNAWDGKEDGLIYIFDGKPHGMITFTMAHNVASKIGLMAVSPDLRGKGIGTLLIREAEKLSGEKKSTSIQVITQNANRIALAFYQKTGFNIIDSHRVYHWWRG